MLPLIVIVVPLFVVMAIHGLIQSNRTPRELRGKVVLITGASSGLGAACAQRFTTAGAKVIMCARDLLSMNAIKDAINPGTEDAEWPRICQVDLSKPADIDTLVAELRLSDVQVDILVNNAGISQRATVADTTMDTHHRIMDVNFFGPVQLTSALIGGMVARGDGHVITIGSVQGKIAIPFRCAYAASKHAVQAFSDSLRAEVASSGVHVTVVNPGYIRTNLSRNALAGDGTAHGQLDATTATGMSASFVADHILNAAHFPIGELTLSDFKSRVGIWLRNIIPSGYFWMMSRRAAKAT